MLWLALPWPREPLAGPADANARSPTSAPASPDALGWWALRFTPRVARVDEVLLMEVSASLRLWGGLAALQRRILEQNPALTPADIAPAAIGLVAIAHLRLRAQQRAVPAGGVSALPLHTLGAARAQLPLLQRLGLRSWGEADSLPRAAMVRRFGSGLRAALDVAFGRAPEHYPWLTLPERFDQALELPAHADAAPALLWSASRLLAALQSWLCARQLGVLAFELSWTLDRRRLDGRDLPPAQSLCIRTAEPAQAMAHLRRLLAERLARTALLAPAARLRLRALQTAPWQPGNASLLPGEQRRGEPLHVLLERASARLGPDSVRQVALRADHRPECRQRWQAAEKWGSDHHFSSAPIPLASEKARLQPALDALAPAWLLRPPQPLPVRDGRPWHGAAPLRLLTGPQRIEAGWWPEGHDAEAAAGAPVARDYFIAQGDSAALLWVFCERPTSQTAPDAPARWFVQGVYA